MWDADHAGVPYSQFKELTTTRPLSHLGWLMAVLGIVGGGCSAETPDDPLPGSAGSASGASGAAAAGASGLAGSPTSSAGAGGMAPGSSGMAGSATGTAGVNGTAGNAAGGTSGGGPGGASGSSSGSGGGLGMGGFSNPGTCTASKATGAKVSGSGPHQVTVETNSDAGIKEGTIFRPSDLKGAEKYPIFVWGQGGCSQNGMDTSAAMAEIASHGYFVIADGTPGGGGKANRPLTADMAAMGKPLIAYIDWAINENGKPCSAYFDSLQANKIASNGFSCGGLMAEGTAGDPRLTTWGFNSSGMMSANQNFYKTVHTPVLMVQGGSSDQAYANGLRDYDNISKLGVPILYFSKNIGHGGDLFSSRGGDFNKINLAWLNWHLKGDMTATGKGRLVGAGCSYCSDAAWEVKSANLP
jgi:hypothetical protein